LMVVVLFVVVVVLVVVVIVCVIVVLVVHALAHILLVVGSVCACVFGLRLLCIDILVCRSLS
jgi:hypothetical protein